MEREGGWAEGGEDGETLALIALPADGTAVKTGDVRRRRGMFGVVTARKCCKRFPFSFHIYTAMTLQRQLAGKAW